MDTSLKSLYRNAAEWLAGPTGSVLIHVAVILAAIFLFSMVTPKKEDPYVEVTVVEVEETVLDELETEEFEPPEELNDIVDPVDIPEVDMDMPPPDIPDDFAADSSMVNDVSALVIASDVSSPIVMKGLMAGEYSHRSGAGRAGAGGYAGQWAEAAEAAVKRALVWFKNNQSKDGSWGSGKQQVGLTGLAVLTFLAHGETTQSQEFGDTVQRALQYLIAKQNEKGEFCTIEPGSGQTAYSHAIATYAVSEAYGMMRIPGLKPTMEKAVEVLIKGQQPHGGYDYGFVTSSSREDVSEEAWCCQAMQAARIAGAKTPGLDEAIEKTIAAIKRAFHSDDGSFSYTHDNGKLHIKHTHNTTAMAVLAMQLTGHGNDQEARKGLSFLSDAKCKWKDPQPWPMYGWYYISQVKFHQGGDSWRQWNAQFAPQFIREQWIDDPNNKELYGSWESAGVAVKGKGDFDSGYEDYNRAYATAMAALTLQVYYRHLQTYQPIQPSDGNDKSGGDVTIEIL